MYQNPAIFPEHYHRHSKDEARPLSRGKNNAADVYINKVDRYTHIQCILAPQRNKFHTPVNPTATPGIVPAVALNADLLKCDADDLSGLSSAQD
jgi:hypothetical protein